MVHRVHYDALASYHSYELAWLGPIVLPLGLALIAQVIVYSDMLRHRCCPAMRWPLRKASGDPPPVLIVETMVMSIMLAETIFGILCIVSCIINFAQRAYVSESSGQAVESRHSHSQPTPYPTAATTQTFARTRSSLTPVRPPVAILQVGGYRVCDYQAFYSTYYVFAGMALGTYGVIFGALVRANRRVSLPLVIGSAIAIHAIALIIAALPLMGAGEYLFAVDFCTMNVEGALFSTLTLVYYVLGLLVIMGCLVWASRAGASVTKGKFGSAVPPSRPWVLYIAAAWFAVAWFSVALLALLSFGSSGPVYADHKWAYAVMALLVHSNQVRAKECAHLLGSHTYSQELPMYSCTSISARAFCMVGVPSCCSSRCGVHDAALRSVDLRLVLSV